MIHSGKKEQLVAKFIKQKRIDDDLRKLVLVTLKQLTNYCASLVWLQTVD